MEGAHGLHMLFSRLFKVPSEQEGHCRHKAVRFLDQWTEILIEVTHDTFPPLGRDIGVGIANQLQHLGSCFCFRTRVQRVLSSLGHLLTSVAGIPYVIRQRHLVAFSTILTKASVSPASVQADTRQSEHPSVSSTSVADSGVDSAGPAVSRVLVSAASSLTTSSSSWSSHRLGSWGAVRRRGAGPHKFQPVGRSR